MDFLEVVLEAKKKKKINIKPPETKSTDYTEDVEEDQEETETEEEETPADDEDAPEDNEPTDYTEEAPDDTVESDEEEPVGGEDDVPEDSEPTDYTNETPEDGDDDNTDNPEDTPEDGAEDTPSDGDVEAAENPSENPEADARNKRLLQEDYIDLYFRTKDFITKLSSLDKTNVILNQITVQIDKNLNRLKKALWDYVVYEYDKAPYITNLYKYNQLIEAFKANLEMLSLAREHIIKEEDNKTKKAKNAKRGR